jgi:hypothetical protein
MRVKALLVAALASLLLAPGITARATSSPVPPRLGEQRISPQNPQPQPTTALTPEQLVALADDVAKEVEALRGWSFKQPIRKELTTVAQMRQYLEQQADKSVPPGRMRLSQAFLRTIGLIPPDADLKKTWMGLLESQVGGFYVPETKTMHLVARDGLPPFVERIMLAHELTHALDDQYVDLQGLTKARADTTEDLDLTSEAVVEGSATALMMQYAARAMMAGRIDQDALQQYAKQESERSQVFLDAPRYFSAMLGSYICGTQFLARGQLLALMLAPDDKAVGEALLAARKDMPRSTEQILHPDKYWNAATRDEPIVIDDAAAEKWLRQPGRWVVHTDTVGEMLIAILTSARGASATLTALQSSEAWTNAAASGWGGDRFYLVASGDTADGARTTLNNLKGAWVTAWDTPKDRDEFLAALPKGSLAPGAVADATGNSVAVVYFGVDDGERSALTARLRDTPLPMTQGGRPWPGAARN